MSDPDVWPPEPDDDDPDRGRGQSPRSFPGAEILRGRHAGEVLERICEGDPLDLEGRCTHQLHERAFMIDIGRLKARAMARVAYAAPKYRGKPPLPEWLAGLIDKSMEELLEEDHRDEVENAPITEAGDAGYGFVAETLGLEPQLARRACIAFNSLPYEERAAFWAVFVEGKSLRRYAAELGIHPRQAKRRLERAVVAMGTLGEAGEL